MKISRQVFSLFWVLTWLFTARAGAATSPDLGSLSLEQLMEIEITSVSKRSQKLEDAAAAIFVITQDDIRRSGATNIPELLRMVPGIQVARIDASHWAITARGFNDLFASKLLVLMDGRTLYTPIFSGILWSRQDTVLEDIERIEVIRGPGGSLWGANAVNGVINIITKRAKDTQGGLVSALAGAQDRGMGIVRYGGSAGHKIHYRVYVKGKDIGNTVDRYEGDNPDDWRMLQGGFRVDWDLSPGQDITVQGDVYSQTLGEKYADTSLTPPYYSDLATDTDGSGGNILFRWTKQTDSAGDYSFQCYYDTTHEKDVEWDWDVDILDFEFQHTFSWGSRQQWTWGLGYRLDQVDLQGGPTYEWQTSHEKTSIFNAFIQDEITLIPDRLRLTLGSKLEHNDFTGFEIQPSARILLNLDRYGLLWASVSRAVRTPSLNDLYGTIRFTVPPEPPLPLPFLFQLEGQEDLDSEDLVAVELGYRKNVRERMSLDLAAYANFYDSLIAFPPPSVSLQRDPVAHVMATADFANVMEGEVYGFEAALNWDPVPKCRLRAAYSLSEMFLHPKEGEEVGMGEEAEGSMPQQMFSLRAEVDLPGDFELDTWLRYMDGLPASDIPSYVTADLRLAWHPRPNLEFSLVGQNLFDPHHPEFTNTINPTAAPEIERSFYGKITWRF